MKGLASSSLKVSEYEVRALEFFCVKTAPELGMYFDTRFWRSLLVQASLVESALAHAVATVGIFAEQRSGLCDNEQHNLETSHEYTALATYNKSITRLAKLSVSANDKTEVILLACILYICVEFLRGNEGEAIRHFNGGMAIITSLMRRNIGSSNADGTIDRIRSTSILTFFNRLEMLARAIRQRLAVVIRSHAPREHPRQLQLHG